MAPPAINSAGTETFQGFFRVILVEPGDSRNLGATARAMSNLGFTDLALVAPRHLDLERAAAVACWGAPLLQSLKIFPSLAAALTDRQEVVAFSARRGRNRHGLLPLPEWSAARLPASLARTALVFGPEEDGLRREHLEQCRQQVYIPAVPANPSYNLGQAVLIVLYELFRHLAAAGTVAPAVDQPTWQEFAALERLIDSAARHSEFFRAGTPAPVPALLQNIFRRFQPNRRELAILLGFFNRINRKLNW